VSGVSFGETGRSLQLTRKVIGYTWQYVNKDGGPDRWFANNPQIPIASYEQVPALRSGIRSGATLPDPVPRIPGLRDNQTGSSRNGGSDSGNGTNGGA